MPRKMKDYNGKNEDKKNEDIDEKNEDLGNIPEELENWVRDNIFKSHESDKKEDNFDLSFSPSPGIPKKRNSKPHPRSKSKSKTPPKKPRSKMFFRGL